MDWATAMDSEKPRQWTGPPQWLVQTLVKYTFVLGLKDPAMAGPLQWAVKSPGNGPGHHNGWCNHGQIPICPWLENPECAGLGH